MEKANKICIGIVGICFLGLCLLVWFKPSDTYSKTERRQLKQFPEVTAERILNGRFMSDFESYGLDQFPMRDELRSLKAATSLKLDNNDIYVVDGYINSMEYPLNTESLLNASGKFQKIYEMYLKENNCQVYFSIIPDKNYFFAKENGYLALNYEELISVMERENGSFMTYIDIFGELTGESYYKTDTHWRQEKLLPVVEKLMKGMETEMPAESMLTETSAEETGLRSAEEVGLRGEYQEHQLEEEFYGVYYGQAALPLAADKISYLTNEVIDNYRVFDYEHNKEIDVYDMEKVTGDDPYEMFLGGSLSLVTIENEKNADGRELIIFRDSFGSSIAPLLAQGYAKTTLIDIRYLQSGLLGELVDFQNADVLFLYSTSVLNHSETLK